MHSCSLIENEANFPQVERIDAATFAMGRSTRQGHKIASGRSHPPRTALRAILRPAEV
jgi:hypothetical protein